jgi:hypothetical protein
MSIECPSCRSYYAAPWLAILNPDSHIHIPALLGCVTVLTLKGGRNAALEFENGAGDGAQG